MTATPESRPAHDYAERIRRQLSHHPELAFNSLSLIICHEARRKLAVLIAQNWARKDINTAWNTVARSALNAAEKQIMFNELWG